MKIKLYNRYNENIWLEKKNELEYSLEGNLDYCRIIFEDNECTIIQAVDPSGGPFISINNFEIDNNTKVLESIKENPSGTFTLKFKLK